MKISDLQNKLDIMIPNPVCELKYNKPYELLIAVMLSAQSTDKRVNIATEELFSKYTLNDLITIDETIIENIIKPVGTYKRKTEYIKKIATALIDDYNGEVPNDREYLEKLNGIGRKSTNVILSEIFKVPSIAVDTHVERVSKKLNLVEEKDNVIDIENKLMKYLKKEDWSRVQLQLVLFGRYICTSKKPKCGECLFNTECKNSSLRT